MDVDGRGTSGVSSSRDAHLDWANAYLGKSRHPAVRLEWVGPRSGDPFDSSTTVDAAEWVDAISATADGGAVRLRLVRQGERVVTQRVEVVAQDGALTRRYLRAVGLGEVVAEVEKVLGDWSVSRFLGTEWRREVWRPGRAGRPDAEYAVWAKRYVDALAVAPRSPVKHIIDEDAARGEHRTEKEVRAKVNRARERGLLTRAPSGRAGGEMTAKGLMELRRIGEG